MADTKFYNQSPVDVYIQISRGDEVLAQDKLVPDGVLTFRPPDSANLYPPSTEFRADFSTSPLSQNDRNAIGIAFFPRSGDVFTVSQSFNRDLTVTESRAALDSASIEPAGRVPCFVAGTLISTKGGPVAVERLALGDMVTTEAGECRPIRWIGSRHYSGFSAPPADRPVRIRANAVADGIPTRDLLVSPDHAVFVDGLLAAAGHLVNGTSITRGEAMADLTYWHLELDSHDLVLAENTPAESFLAAPGVRAGFDAVRTLDADLTPRAYAVRTGIGPALAAVRGRLARRATSVEAARDLGPVRAWLDRCTTGADGLLHVGGWAQDVARPDAPVCLDIVVDGTVAAFTVADELRTDLAAAGVGDGRHGFDLGVDVRLASGVAHIVEVRRSADGALVCAKQVDAAGAWTPLLAA
jgi:hypothetical protein